MKLTKRKPVFLKCFFLATFLGFFAFFAVQAWADCSVTFSWLPNPDTEQVQGYRIHYGTAQGGPYTETVEVGKPAPVDGRIKWTISSGFTEGTTYYFVSTAYNSAGESSYSDEVSWICESESPGDVQNVIYSRSGDSVTFNWTNPSDDDYAGVKIVYTIDGSDPALNDDGTVLNGTEFDKVTAPDTSTTKTLAPGVSYKFAFFTYDGSGNYSHTVFITIPVVTVNYTPNPIENPKTQVTFAVSIDPECLGTVNYAWNFDDGNTASVTSSTINHVFNTAKTYNVQLTLTGENGCTIIKTIPIQILDPPPLPPANPQ